MRRDYPSKEYLLSLFDYDSEDGGLHWKGGTGRPWNGKLAGKVDQCGHVNVRHNGANLLAHRVVWIMHHGEIPDRLVVDHINGIRHDNRISNLRLANTHQNAFHTRMSKRNKSGFRGVCRLAGQSKWIAQISINRRVHFLGSFNTPEEASEAYKTKAQAAYGEFYHPELMGRR